MTMHSVEKSPPTPSLGGGMHSDDERQRISIAPALLKAANLVPLHQATASVDPFAEADIQRAVNERVLGKTVVVIAHCLRTIQQASQIIVLDRGKVGEEDTRPELLEHTDLDTRLWRAQMTTSGFGTRRIPEEEV